MLDFFKKNKSSELAIPLDSEVNTTPEIAHDISWAERLKNGLSRTRNAFGNQLSALFGGGKIDAEVYEELETILLTSDVGVAATEALLNDIKSRVKRDSLDDTAQLKAALKAAMLDLLTPLQQPLILDKKPYVIMLCAWMGQVKPPP